MLVDFELYILNHNFCKYYGSQYSIRPGNKVYSLLLLATSDKYFDNHITKSLNNTYHDKLYKQNFSMR